MTTPPEDVQPYVGEPAADFDEGDEPVYVLVGAIIHATDNQNTTTHHLLMGQGLTTPIDSDLLPLFEFFSTAREEHQAEEWLQWAGANDDLLSQMVKLGYLVRIDTRSPTAAAESLSGLRLSPQSSPGEVAGNGHVGVLPEQTDKPSMFVAPELAVALWSNDEDLDMPAIVRRIAQDTGMNEDLVARRVLVGIPMLLEYGWARLEWLRVPNS